MGSVACSFRLTSALKCRPRHLRHPAGQPGWCRIRGSVNRRDPRMISSSCLQRSPRVSRLPPLSFASVSMSAVIATMLPLAYPLARYSTSSTVSHNPEGFRLFFSRIEKQKKKHRLSCSGGDGRVQWLCPPIGHSCKRTQLPAFQCQQSEAGSFQRDIPRCRPKPTTSMPVSVWSCSNFAIVLPLAKDALQEVAATPVENEILKRLTRRRRRLVNERARVLNNMQGDLQAVCPGLLEITADAGNLWFLRFLTSTDSLIKLARLHRATLLKITGVGVKYAATHSVVAETRPF